MRYVLAIKHLIRELIAVMIISMFAGALWHNPSDQMMIGALIGAFSTAIGFFLGSSKKDERAQPVTVENTASNPVPVEPKE